MAFGDKAVVGVQNPVRLDEDNERRPDFSVMRPRADFYTSSHPTAADLFLIIEVAETSLRYDRSIKAPLYARFGIPEYWMIKLAERFVEVYRGPARDRYRRVRRRSGDDIIRPRAVPDVRISVGDITG
jgi:Uma2 family endonuclease